MLPSGPTLLSPSMDQGMNSIMAAAIGLSTLGVPSPPGVMPSVTNEKATAREGFSPIESKSAVQSGKSSEPSTGDRNSTNNLIAVTQPSAPFESLPRTTFPPSSTIAGDFDFGPIWRPSVPYSDVRARLTSATTIAMDRFLLADRVNAMKRATLFASHHQLSHSLYYPNYPGDIGCGGTSLSRPVPAPIDPFTVTSSISSTKNFPETLFDIISAKEYSPIIAWLPHGQGFIIHDKQLFAMMILDRHFAGAKFTSFTRRLKRWNFVRVPRGPELGAYYNPNFKRDQPELVQMMIYRMEGEDDKDADYEEGHKIGEQEVEKNDGENPLKEAKKSPLSLPSTPTKRPSRDKSSPVCAIIDRPKKAAKNEVLNLKRRADSMTTGLAQAEERMVPLPSTLPKRPANNSNMSFSDSTLSDHLKGFVSVAGSSLMPLGVIDDRYELMLKLRREILAGSMTPGFLDGSNSVTLSGRSPSESENDIERAERRKLIIEAERVVGINRCSSDFLSSSTVDNRFSSDFLSSSSVDPSLSDITASLPTFYQGSGDIRANPMLRSTLPHLRWEQSGTELPLSYIQRRLVELQSRESLWYNARQEVAQGLCVDAVLSEARDRSRSVLMTAMEEAEYEMYLRVKNCRG